MPQPRKEETVTVRIRRSSYGVACRVASNECLSSLAQAVEAMVLGWDLLTREQQAECLGHEYVKGEPEDWESLDED